MMYEKIKIRTHLGYICVSQNSGNNYEGLQSFKIIPIENIEEVFENKKVVELYADPEQPSANCDNYAIFELYNEEEEESELVAIEYMSDEELKEYCYNHELNEKNITKVYDSIWAIPSIKRIH